MGYINGLRSFGHKSELAAKRSRSKKRESTGKWKDALAKAERAHWLCRKAAELASEGKTEEAEETATRGIDELKERSVFYSVFLIGYLITDECHDSVAQAPDMGPKGIPESYDKESALNA
jgi:hypothetical protein